MYVYAAAGLLGALLMFFLDPDRGAYRRSVTRDRILGTVRRAGVRAAREGRHIASDAAGTYQRLTHVGERRQLKDERPADPTLAAKVQTELFRDRDIPKGKLNINAADGTVWLRGEVERPSDINEIERRVRDIEGVEEVENLLHLPGTPALRSS